MHKKDVKFFTGIGLCTLVAACIFPGIDTVAYLFLRPITGFWERIIFLIILLFTAGPMIWVALAIWSMLLILWCELVE